MFRVRDSLIVERPWRTAYIVGVIVLATFWLGWPGLVVTLLMTLNYNPRGISL